MKTTKTQYFLWKSDNTDTVVVYTPSNATTEGMTYYIKNYRNREFSKAIWRDSFDNHLAGIKFALKRSGYHFICSLLIPSDHTNEDLTKYYTTIKKNLSL